MSILQEEELGMCWDPLFVMESQDPFRARKLARVGSRLRQMYMYGLLCLEDAPRQTN